jgi:FeS assembly protein IscX
MELHTFPLYWDSTFEIALALIAAYPDVDLDDVGLEQLYQWVIALQDFADEPALANEAILTDILREWFEEVSAR